MATNESIYNTSDDLIYAILVGLGGSSEDIEIIYNNSTNDLLYGILKVLTGNVDQPPSEEEQSIADENNVPLTIE